MFTDKMARITAEFTDRIIEALRASAAEELRVRRAADTERADRAERAAKTSAPASTRAAKPAPAMPVARPVKPAKAKGATKADQLRLALETRIPATRLTREPASTPAKAGKAGGKAGRATNDGKAAKKAAVVTSDMIAAANRYFASRGNKGATATQLSAHLVELGHDDSADVVSVLTERGAIRDAGFRRSTGQGNKTSAVFVSA